MKSGQMNGFSVFAILISLLFSNGCKLFDDKGVEPPVIFPKPIIGPIDFAPAWSPNGDKIIYFHHSVNYSDTTNPSGFYLINPDGSKNQLFLKQEIGFIGDPDWSPDGKWIVFCANQQILKIRANGEDLTQLTSEGRNFFPDWSLDGRKIAYDCTTDPPGRGIWIMDADGGNKHRLGLGRTPNWSPNGKKLTYEGGPGPTEAESQIWTVDTSGVNQKQLTFFAVSNRNPVWSPDGSKIVFVSFTRESSIWLIDSSGNDLHKLTESSFNPCDWSPDGKQIVYTSAPEGHWIYDTLPDGHIVFDRFSYKAGSGRLWTIDIDGSNKKQLTKTAQCEKFSPNKTQD